MFLREITHPEHVCDDVHVIHGVQKLCPLHPDAVGIAGDLPMLSVWLL